jgi:hypothetical protein
LALDGTDWITERNPITEKELEFIKTLKLYNSIKNKLNEESIEKAIASINVKNLNKDDSNNYETIIYSLIFF